MKDEATQHSAMYHPEEAVDKILEGLRTAQPPAGMEQRILASLQLHGTAVRTAAVRKAEAHAAFVPAAPWHRLRPRWLTAPRLAFSSCVVAALVAVAVAAIHSRPPVPGKLMNQPAVEQAAAKPVPMPGNINPTAMQTSAVASGGMRSSLTPAQKTARDADRALRSKDRSSSEQASYLVSFPAPPLPLTDQERMLLQIARRRDPGNAAALDRAKQEIQIAKDQAQFQDFFDHPVVKSEQPPPTADPAPENAANLANESEEVPRIAPAVKAKRGGQ